MDFAILEQILSQMMVIYLSIVLGTSLWFNIIAYKRFKKYNQYKSYKEILELNNIEQVPVSLLVPAHNEEVTIVDTITSLLALDYKKYEIIIINDGSTDATSEVIKEAFSLKVVSRQVENQLETKEVQGLYKGKIGQVAVTLIDKENGGKADSLNAGINYSRYPVFAAIDADCLLLEDALKKIMVPFAESSETIAVGGNIKIANHTLIEKGKLKRVGSPKQLLVCFQVIEYLRAFLTCRMSLDAYNMNFIISGAFGVFSKKAVLNVGGYRTRTVGEDMELVMRLHKYYLNKKEPYAIRFAADAYCYTQAPNSLKDLKSQRMRWQIGLLQCMLIHPKFFRGKTWFMTKVYYVMTELISPFIEGIGFVILIFALVFGKISFGWMSVVFVVYLCIGIFNSLLAILLEMITYRENTNPKLVRKLIVVSMVETLGYRQIISFYRLIGLFSYRRNKEQWGKIIRTKQNIIEEY